MNAVQRFFRPAEKHEDGRLKRYDEMSEAGKEATDFRMKVMGKFFLVLLIGGGFAWFILEANYRHEKALQSGEYERMFSE